MKTAGGKSEHGSVSLARRFVEVALQGRRFAKGGRLPVLRLLALKAGVAPTHMLRALHQLQAEGAVTIVKNRGIFAGRPEDRVRLGDAESLQLPPREKWMRIRSRLEQDIYEGRYPKGLELPPLRELALRYGASPPTLRKALHFLESAGIIEPQERSYRVPRPARLSGQAAVLFTAWVPPEQADAWFRRDRILALMAALHSACAEANLRLLVTSYHPRHGFRWHSFRGASPDKLRGLTYRAHIAWAPTLPERDLRRLCADLAGLHPGAKPPKVGTREAPLAILDGAKGSPMSLPRSGDYPCTRIFSVARKRSGEQVARYLLAAGHRRIAFLSACHAEPWSKDRLFGMRQACKAAGYPDAVRAFAVAKREDVADKPDLPPALLRHETAFAAGLAALEAELGRDSQKWHALNLKLAYELFRWTSRTGYSLRDMVERLRAWGPTAVVAASDVMALTALNWLRSAGVRIPEDMAIVGFDDDRYSADNDLTSYNFNMGGIAESMLRYVLAPEKAPAADRDRSVECPGILIERGSSRARLHSAGPPR